MLKIGQKTLEISKYLGHKKKVCSKNWTNKCGKIEKLSKKRQRILEKILQKKIGQNLSKKLGKNSGKKCAKKLGKKILQKIVENTKY